MEIFSPSKLKSLFPSPTEFVDSSRKAVQNILQKKNECYLAIVGPCSIHDIEAALEYAEKLHALQKEVGDSLFLVMRLFFEKSRTGLGWKGFLTDPHLDESNDLVQGLEKSRALLLEITRMGVPCGAELLDPLAVPYFDDLLVWGAIGARTVSSQTHRQIASGVLFPVGFKNDLHGTVDSAVSGILSSRAAHAYLGIDEEGKIAVKKTSGNPFSHLVLRGGDKHPNCDPAAISKVLRILHAHYLEPVLLVDCSHGNSGKDHRKQPQVLRSLLEQENPAIRGFMLESFLFPGKQPLKKPLEYGVSITDSCLGWGETADLLYETAARLKDRNLSFKR